MKNLVIVFTLVSIIMYFGINEACPENRFVLENDIGPNIPVQYHCLGLPGQDTGVKVLKYRTNYTHWFKDVFRKRTTWTCQIRYGNPLTHSFDRLQVYRGARDSRCNQLRHWSFRINGIYFRRDQAKSLGYVLPWTKIM
ncbi:unnamed protein product [Cochlearia groenlandica]